MQFIKRNVTVCKSHSSIINTNYSCNPEVTGVQYTSTIHFVLFIPNSAVNMARVESQTHTCAHSRTKVDVLSGFLLVVFSCETEYQIKVQQQELLSALFFFFYISTYSTECKY